MIQKLISKIKIDKSFIKNSLLVFFGSLLVSILNYFFRASSGRLLGPTNYGIIGFLISIISILLIFSTSINNAVTKFCAIYIAQNKLSKVKYIHKKLTLIAFISGLIVTIIVFLSSNFIGTKFKIEPIYIRYISLAFLFVFATTVNKGIFQGKKKFKKFTLINIIESGSKLAILFALFYAGFGIFSAIIAIVTSLAISYIASKIMLINELPKKNKKIELKNFFSYFSFAFLSLGLFSLIAFIDIPLAKYYLNDTDAGLYSALSDIGKIIFYAIVPIMTVMFPVITDKFTKNEKHYHLLLQTIAIVFSLGIPAIIIYYLYPEFVIKILYGKQYISVANNLFKTGLAMFILILCNMFVQYFLSVKKNYFHWFIILAIILEIMLFKFYHANISDLINNLIISFSFMLLSFIIYYLFDKRDRIKRFVIESINIE